MSTRAYIRKVGNIYAPAICMDCGTENYIVEEVDTGNAGIHDLEQWSYCPPCNAQTFQPAYATQIEIMATYKLTCKTTGILIADTDRQLSHAMTHAQRMANELHEPIVVTMIADESGKEYTVDTVLPMQGVENENGNGQ